MLADQVSIIDCQGRHADVIQQLEALLNCISNSFIELVVQLQFVVSVFDDAGLILIYRFPLEIVEGPINLNEVRRTRFQN